MPHRFRGLRLRNLDGGGSLAPHALQAQAAQADCQAQERAEHQQRLPNVI